VAGMAMFTGPSPDEGRQFCSVCAMVFKAKALEAIKDWLAMVQQLPNGHVKWHELKSDVPLQHAVCKSIYQPLANWGQLDLCWSHAMGLNLSAGLLPASAAQMPQGPGGAVLLGQ
jgi:hypothetical protein